MGTAALFAMLVVSNYACWGLSELTGADAQLWFYIAQGLQTAVLFVLLAECRNGAMWRPVCAFGAFHGGAQAVCGAAYLARPITPAPWDNLADAQTGLPVTRASLCAALVLAALIYERELRCPPRSSLST